MAVEEARQMLGAFIRAQRQMANLSLRQLSVLAEVSNPYLSQGRANAVDDHIVPWAAGYQTTQLLGGQKRYVLSTSGHIAGIVNPPGPKSKHWTNDALPTDPQEWKDGAQLNEGSWWEDWTGWIAKQGGPMVAAPSTLGNNEHPPLEPAPGSSVRND